MCAENECALCNKLFTYILVALQLLCTLSGPTHFARISKIMKHQARNVVNVMNNDNNN